MKSYRVVSTYACIREDTYLAEPIYILSRSSSTEDY